MEVCAVSVVGNVDIVAADVEVLAVEWLANVTNKLRSEVSITLNQDNLLVVQFVAHMNNHLAMVSANSSLIPVAPAGWDVHTFAATCLSALVKPVLSRMLVYHEIIQYVILRGFALLHEMIMYSRSC